MEPLTAHAAPKRNGLHRIGRKRFSNRLKRRAIGDRMGKELANRAARKPLELPQSTVGVLFRR